MSMKIEIWLAGNTGLRNPNRIHPMLGISMEEITK